MEKAPKSRRGKRAPRHDPLGEQIIKDKKLTSKAQAKQRIREKRDAEIDNNIEEDMVSDAIPSSLSRKILQEARAQQEEEGEEEMRRKEKKNIRFDSTTGGSSFARNKNNSNERGGYNNNNNNNDDDDDDWRNELSENEEDYDDEDIVEIDPEDEKLMELFMKDTPSEQKTLADIIMEKFKEHQEGMMDMGGDMVDQSVSKVLDPKVIMVYQKLAVVLKRYRSGKLPKAFKLIPAMQHWEELMYLTKPDEWSPAVMFHAARIFSSNLKDKLAQRFYNLVLLPRVRDDIERNKKLNFWLYMALKKSLFKPGSFFKGLLLPLCEGGDCSLREAAIIGSVLLKVSIPVLHSSVALLKLAEMEYSGANSIFIRVLLDKKYSLPVRVINALVLHFARFTNDQRTLPVLWHQALLTFVERYKNQLTKEQKHYLKLLLRAHSHHLITPAIRRELFSLPSKNENV